MGEVESWCERLEALCDRHGLERRELAERFGYPTEPRGGFSEKQCERMVGAAHRELERLSGVRWRDVILWRTGTTGREGRANVPHEVKRHSPTGFDWGYEGSGPADLALNVLLAFGVEPEKVERLYQRFKRDVIAEVPREGGRIRREEVMGWVQEQKVDDAAETAAQADAGAEVEGAEAVQAAAGMEVQVPEQEEEDEELIGKPHEDEEE